MRQYPVGSPDWDGLLVEFRALGGTADNIALRQGPRGRGLFPIDPSKRVKLRLPPNLVVSTDQTELRDNQLVISKSAPIGTGERAFFDRYQREFSWGSGVFDELWEQQLTWSRVPKPIQDALRATIRIDNTRFSEPSVDLCLKRYFLTRQILYLGNRCVMPLVELMNHRGRVPTYDLTDGITVAGRFEDEILVSYSPEDCWGKAAAYGFCEPEHFSHSLTIALNYEGHKIWIGRAFREMQQFNGVPLPRVVVEGSTIGFSYLMLGNAQYPRLARSVFLHVAKQTPIKQADEVFGIIQHMNRQKLLEFLRVADGDGSPLVASLRRAAMYQLETLSHHWGAVPIGPSAPNPRPVGAILN